MSASIKKQYGANDKTYDYIVAGGSNALIGISAQTIARKTSSITYNIAISACEGAGLLNYPIWLSQMHLKTKTVIYSSMNIWHLAMRSPCELYSDSLSDQDFRRPFITVPLARTISNTLSQMPFTINEHGDLTVPYCDKRIKPFDKEFAHKDNIADSRIKKFIELVNSIKQSLRAEEILVRAPPIFVSAQSIPEFKNYLSYVHSVLRENGITLLGTEQALTTDPTKMCFGHNHPTTDARAEYTDALIQEITTYKQLVLQ